MNVKIIPSETIEHRIYLIRGQKVMLDSQLADLYGVPTKSLNLAVKRNRERFPEDFMFQLTDEEYRQVLLRFQIETSKAGKGGRRYNPYVFTEQGVAMLSSVLRSKNAVQVNIGIMRVFVKIREIISTNKELAQKLSELEHKIEKHDTEIQAIFEAIRQLLQPPEKPKRRIGFCVEEPKAKYKV
ncbi:MAG: ORF6N domain-containing protein [Bacteroidota bacterium]|nr:ORF6N domain-containing protein [Bacteroidota bacterium]